jgi:hypothetical protein
MIINCSSTGSSSKILLFFAILLGSSRSFEESLGMLGGIAKRKVRDSN